MCVEVHLAASDIRRRRRRRRRRRVYFICASAAMPEFSPESRWRGRKSRKFHPDRSSISPHLIQVLAWQLSPVRLTWSFNIFCTALIQFLHPRRLGACLRRGLSKRGRHAVIQLRASQATLPSVFAFLIILFILREQAVGARCALELLIALFLCWLRLAIVSLDKYLTSGKLIFFIK